MRRFIMSFLFLLAVAMAPQAALAAIQVTISDGTTTKSASFTGFNLSTSTSAGATTTLTILSSSPRFFPSGGTSAAGTDTFKIENSTIAFQCKKTDSLTVGSPQLLEIKGLKATALSPGNGKKLIITCENTSGTDYRSVSSTSGSYSVKNVLKGEFRDSTSTARTDNIANACEPTSSKLTISCIKQQLSVNGISLNAQGQASSLTVTVPCSNSLDTDANGVVDAPCGPSGTGTYNPLALIGDQFTATDQGTVSCGTTCNPKYKIITTIGPFAFKVPPGFSTAQGEIVKLTNSASAGLADGGVTDPLGAENLEAALASDAFLASDTTFNGLWLGYCGNVSPDKAVPQPPLTNGTRNSTNASIPLKFALAHANFVQAGPGGFTMESVGNGDNILPPGDRASNDACYEIHIPKPGLQFKNVSDVTLTYSFVTTSQLSSYPTLQSAGQFAYDDCFDACFRAYISLQDSKGVFRGRLIVYLGNNGDFKGQHATGDCCSGDNLVGLTDLRVDASQMLGNLSDPDPMSFSDTQSPGKFGNLFVRSFIVVLDQGSAADNLNHRLTLTNASFNGSTASQFLQVVGPYAPSCEWPSLDGLQMAIFRATDGTRTLVETLSNLTVDSQCLLRGDVQVNALDPIPGPNTYEVWVQRDGGVSLADVGVMTIFAD